MGRQTRQLAAIRSSSDRVATASRIVDSLHSEINGLNLTIRKLEQVCLETRTAKPTPRPGVPGKIWVEGKKDPNFSHPVSAHIQKIDCVYTDPMGHPVSGELVVLDELVAPCGEKVHTNPYHSSECWTLWDCCPKCLKLIDKELS